MKIDGLGSGLNIATNIKDSSYGADFENVLSQAIESKDNADIKEACDKMEEYFITSIFKQMKASINRDENSLIPKGDYEEMFEGQMIELQAAEAVKAGGIGLADMMYKELTREKGV